MALKRSFSLDEVNALVPSLDSVFQRLGMLRKEIAARANEVERLGFKPAMTRAEEIPEPVVERQRIIDARVADFQAEVDKIEAMGGFLKDLDLGLVDFPAERDGPPAHWCWQYGEPAVTHYHPPGAEFGARRPIGGDEDPGRLMGKP